jgi:hypothetical protein
MYLTLQLYSRLTHKYSSHYKDTCTHALFFTHVLLFVYFLLLVTSLRSHNCPFLASHDVLGSVGSSLLRCSTSDSGQLTKTEQLVQQAA